MTSETVESTVDAQRVGLDVTINAQVMTIRFNREHKRNSITYDMYRDMVDLLTLAENQPEISCVLFASTGSIFTSGHDVSGFSQGLGMAYDEKPSYLFMEKLSAFPKPVVAALNGNAVGIGATMLLHCDLVYAVPEARLVFPFVDMGLIPEFASSHYLPQLMGHRRAMSLLLLDKGCRAEDAIQLGLINETAARDELQARVDSATATIASLSIEAVMLTKRLLKAADHAPGQAAIKEESATFHQLLSSPVVRDKLAAIAQKLARAKD